MGHGPISGLECKEGFLIKYTHAPNNLMRSEEHTSELQSHSDLVCRLLLEKKKYNNRPLRLHSI